MSETASYTVAGMTCGHCVAAVTEELSKLPGVKHVDVRLEDGHVTVESDRPLDPDEVRAAVDEAGYEFVA